MKFCSKCGNELVDEAVICTKCGCAVGQTKTVVQTTNVNAATAQDRAHDPDAWIPLVLGSVALLGMIVRLLSYNFSYNFYYFLYLFDNTAFVTLAFISSVKHIRLKPKNIVMPVLGLVFGCISILIYIIFYFFARY